MKKTAALTLALASGGASAIPAVGVDWVNPRDFGNVYEWQTVADACPNRECSGEINGYDLTGLTWANEADFISLVNFYIGEEAFSGGYYSEEFPSAWNTGERAGWGWQFYDFFEANRVYDESIYTEGWLAETHYLGSAGLEQANYDVDESEAYSYENWEPYAGDDDTGYPGAWLYRGEISDTDIPEPGVFGLLIVGLGWLGSRRRTS